MMKRLREAFERLSGRFDFGRFKREDKRAARETRARRPPKRKRRR